MYVIVNPQVLPGQESLSSWLIDLLAFAPSTPQSQMTHSVASVLATHGCLPLTWTTLTSIPTCFHDYHIAFGPDREENFETVKV